MILCSRFMVLTLGFAAGACVNRPRLEVETQSDTAQDVESAPPREGAWRELAARKLEFVAPSPLSAQDQVAMPTKLPPTRDGDVTVAETLPIVIWPHGGTACFPHHVPQFCAHIEENAQGQVSMSHRIDYSEGEATVMSYVLGDGYAERFDRCWYDSAKRVIKHQVQATKRHDGRCGAWDLHTTTQGYDEVGGLVTSEEVRERVLVGRSDSSTMESGATIYQPTYEDLRPLRVVEHDASLDFAYVARMDTKVYEWTDGQLAREDSFDTDGSWTRSMVFTWAGDLLRIDSFTPQTTTTEVGDTVRIYRRRGPGDYAQLYDGPDTHWVYSVADDVEVSTKVVGEVVVERRRFRLGDGERQPLSVEQLLPDVTGLAIVEQWDWSSPDRVTVERQAGRDVYFLDCSALPPIDDLVDPECPPPQPLRGSAKVVLPSPP